MIDDRRAPSIADPAPLGLAAFALTTFVLSVHLAGWAPDIVWIGLALFYGGVAQLLAGMWEFRNRNTFGAVTFSSYGAFWLSLATFVLLTLFHPAALAASDVPQGLAWFLVAFAIFNTYMLLWSTRVNVSVLLVFLTLEATEILLFIGYFRGSTMLLHIGGYVGVATAAAAWYASAAGLINGMTPRAVLPVGGPLWSGVLPIEIPSPRTMPRGQGA
ncbi:MAG: acetate uptake transporter [Candidatus Dormibacteraeota bacterium]|nr:acetate uptake transporter [Candidatus Dormibacteraeota bacterium]